MGWLAWHIAALPKVKRFPKLSQMMTQQGPRKKQTPEQMLAIVRGMQAYYDNKPDRT